MSLWSLVLYHARLNVLITRTVLKCFPKESYRTEWYFGGRDQRISSRVERASVLTENDMLCLPKISSRTEKDEYQRTKDRLKPQQGVKVSLDSLSKGTSDKANNNEDCKQKVENIPHIMWRWCNEGQMRCSTGVQNSVCYSVSSGQRIGMKMCGNCI